MSNKSLICPTHFPRPPFMPCRPYIVPGNIWIRCRVWIGAGFASVEKQTSFPGKQQRLGLCRQVHSTIVRVRAARSAVARDRSATGFADGSETSGDSHLRLFCPPTSLLQDYMPHWRHRYNCYTSSAAVALFGSTNMVRFLSDNVRPKLLFLVSYRPNKSFLHYWNMGL